MVEVCRAITKHHYLVQNAKDIARIVKEAFHIASTGTARPRPDRRPQGRAEHLARRPPRLRRRDGPPRLPPPRPPSPETIREVAAAIKASKRPIIYCGGGVVASNAAAELREFVNKTGIPVAMTLQGLGAFPSDHYLSPRDARDARDRLLELRDQRRRPAARPRRPVRRPGDGQAQPSSPSTAGSSTSTSTPPRSTRTRPPRSR